MSDCKAPWQPGENCFIEYLSDESKVLVDRDVLTVADRDASALLSAMLKSEQSEVGEPGSLNVRARYAEHAAGLTWTIDRNRDLWSLLVHGAQCTQRSADPIRRS